MSRKLKFYPRSWRMKEPFVIARGSQSTVEALVIELSQDDTCGRGEAVGVPYRGEAPASMAAELELARRSIEAGAGRQELLHLLPAGGARNAVDAALWDLEAKLSGIRAWQNAGLPSGAAVDTAMTIGIRPIAAYERTAAQLAGHSWIKVKVDRIAPLEAVSAVRRGAPEARLVVDANQAWSVGELRELAPALAALKVDLLEQPVAADRDAGLAGLRCPVPVCADESVNTIEDLPRLIGRYDFINIKLDKTGGLTAALELASAARASGLRLMSGCMAGSSLAMAPAMVLAQLCEINDLDGPWLQSDDWPGGIVYQGSRMLPPWPAFWG